MTITQLLGLVEETPAYRSLVAALKQDKSHTKTAMLGAAKPYLLAALHRNLKLPVLLITAEPEETKRLYERLSTWTDPNDIRMLPEPDALPYQRMAADSLTELEILQTLSTLANCQSQAPLVIASAPALVQKLPSFKDFQSACQTITVGDEVDPFHLLARWEAIGYRLESLVEVPGTISHRGGIVDIFPPSSSSPVRLEFFGNTVESIRLFDPVSQRSQKQVAEIAVSPATVLMAPTALPHAEIQAVLAKLDLTGLNQEAETQFKADFEMMLDRQRPAAAQFYTPVFNHDSILDYLPPQTVIVLDEPVSVKQVLADFGSKATELRADRISQGELPENFPVPCFTWAELELKVEERRSLELTPWDTPDTSHRLGFSSAPSYTGQIPEFISNVKQLIAGKSRVIVISQQASRLAELLAEADVFAQPETELKEIPAPGSLTLLQGLMDEGWVLGDETYLFTDYEIFGFIKQRRLVKKRPVAQHKLFVDISPGDYVVHIEHGIGKLHGVTTMVNDNISREYLVIKYAGGDNLYVPTDQLDRVSRYVGAGEQSPVLSRLGTQEWSRTKQRTKEAVRAIAEELIELYAARQVMPGIAFSPDTVWQQELEASFPYVETPDQIEVIREVKEDMERPLPMDRLVCGDVGYGKTEVAIRAAFKAVMDNKQVAILVPTTVLAQQHFETFRQRLAAFPVRVDVLSRFRSAKEQKATLAGLKDGSVDICIGTHRLLQKDITFKDLGLLVIDEEQRFGVTHKEHFKQLRKELDVLTLSATPIPRTLHMSLVGVRDMSTIETPPEDRQPIKTYVAEFNDRIVREAVLKEIERNGQAFLVHNRVQSIALIASKLKSIVPEARVTIGHGQMPEGELEKVMTGFVQHEADVLACTTIIESGLDMPNVNTLIVNRADRLGLTQLYQLRGRIGRGGNLAYAYFLYDREKRLTPTAQKRLQTIYEATQLGAGFGIAMKDLEIRGAGSLLGMRQSGHISAVGFNLYTHLLAEAVEELKAKQAGQPVTRPSALPEPKINLPLPAYIPESYLPDLETRLELYNSLVRATRPEQVESVGQEFKDRFGTLPPEVKNLLYGVRVKLLAAKAGIESISAVDSQLIISPFEGMQFDRTKLEPVLKFGVQLGPTQLRFNYKKMGSQWQGVLEEVLKRAG